MSMHDNADTAAVMRWVKDHASEFDSPGDLGRSHLLRVLIFDLPPEHNDGLEERDHEIHTGDDDRVSDDDYFSL